MVDSQRVIVVANWEPEGGRYYLIDLAGDRVPQPLSPAFRRYDRQTAYYSVVLCAQRALLFWTEEVRAENGWLAADSVIAVDLGARPARIAYTISQSSVYEWWSRKSTRCSVEGSVVALRSREGIFVHREGLDAESLEVPVAAGTSLEFGLTGQARALFLLRTELRTSMDLSLITLAETGPSAPLALGSITATPIVDPMRERLYVIRDARGSEQVSKVDVSGASATLSEIGPPLNRGVRLTCNRSFDACFVLGKEAEENQLWRFDPRAAEPQLEALPVPVNLTGLVFDEDANALILTSAGQSGAASFYVLDLEGAPTLYRAEVPGVSGAQVRDVLRAGP